MPLQQAVLSAISPKDSRRNRKRAYAILLYHQVVSPHDFSNLIPGQMVDSISFREQMRFVAEYCRPVPLKEGIYCDDHILYSDFSTRDISFKRKDQLLNIALDSYSSEEQVLIFTSSRKSAITTAKKIGLEIESLIGPREKKTLLETANSLVTSVADPLSKQLVEIMKTGAAFHHAGLNSEQRSIVENAFKK